MSERATRRVHDIFLPVARSISIPTSSRIHQRQSNDAGRQTVRSVIEEALEANPPALKYHRRFKSAENRALDDASGQRQCGCNRLLRTSLEAMPLDRACDFCGLPKEKSPAAAIAPTDGSVGALQGRRLAGGPTPRLQLVTSQATSAEAFSEISDYSSDGAQTESSLHSQPLPQSLSSLHAVAEHVALTAPPRRALRMRKAIFSARA